MNFSKLIISLALLASSSSYAKLCANEPNDVGGFKKQQCVTENRKESLTKACEGHGDGFINSDVGTAASNQVLCSDNTVIKVKIVNAKQGLFEFDRVVGNLDELSAKKDPDNDND